MTLVRVTKMKPKSPKCAKKMAQKSSGRVDFILVLSAIFFGIRSSFQPIISDTLVTGLGRGGPITDRFLKMYLETSFRHVLKI